MKWLLFIPVLFLSLPKGYAQTGKEERPYQPDCAGFSYCKDCGDPQAAYPGKLTKYFEKNIDWQNLSHVTGVVIVRVLIDSAGNPCAGGIYNRSTADGDAVRNLDLNKLVWKMGKWSPAIFDGKPVNSGVLVAFYSRVKGRNLFSVDYLRNDRSRKWVVETDEGPKALMYFDDTATIPD